MTASTASNSGTARYALRTSVAARSPAISTGALIKATPDAIEPRVEADPGNRWTQVIDDVSEVRGDHDRGRFGWSDPDRRHAAQTMATAFISGARGFPDYLQFVRHLLNRVKWWK